MLILGHNNSNINSGNINGYNCDNCNSNNTITAFVFGRYAHLFWIPFFPFGKKAQTVCSNCKNLLTEKEMSESLKKRTHKLKSEAKFPVWYFSGLIIIALLSVFIYFNSSRIAKQELEYINSPQIGDVYEYKMEAFEYSTMKISSVSNDSIFVFLNDYTIGRSSKIHRIDKNENYNQEYIYGYSIEEIKKMYSEGEITGINR